MLHLTNTRIPERVIGVDNTSNQKYVIQQMMAQENDRIVVRVYPGSKAICAYTVINLHGELRLREVELKEE